MKKKILAVTIATALIVSCFTSCDNNTSSDSQASQAEGNYYIWKSGSKLYVSVAGKSSASAGTAYRNLGNVTLDSADIVAQI